jgi:pimeloyl-ACP methyl ester carboxylesterase
VAGGDLGSVIAMSLTQRHPEKLLGSHVTDVGYPDQTTDFAVLSGPEQAYAGAIQQWFFAHGAFNLVQATKPQSLAFAMNDSPVGLAAWIMSFMAGMGVGDEADARFGRDELLTNIMIYWLTETAASSFRIYNQNAMHAPSIKGKEHQGSGRGGDRGAHPGRGAPAPRMGGSPDRRQRRAVP